MRRALAAVLVGLVGLAVAGSAGAQGLPGGVIPRVPLKQHGLERAWVTQTEVVAGRSKITNMQLHRNAFFVQTDVGMLQSIDAETGRTLWRAQVGNRRYPTMPAGIGEQFVCVANGANLYVLNRDDGRLRWETPLENAPTAGLAVGNNRVYVPTVKGRIESYTISELKEGKTVVAEPRQNQIFLGVSGIPSTACLLTPQAIVVGTDSGSLFGFAPGQVGPRFSVETYGEIAAEPAYYKETVIVASRDQFVYGVRETEGDIVWRQSMDEPINQSPVVIGDVIYVVTDLSGMHQLNAADGEPKWFARGIAQFVAAGKDRIYASDHLGRLQVLDPATGKRIDSLNTEAYAVKYTNTQNDRIYLATTTGLLHCLRETTLTEPLVYRTNDEPKAPVTEQKPLDAAKPAAPPAAKPADKPADDAADAEDPAADDAAADEEAPAKEEANDAAADEDLGDFGS